MATSNTALHNVALEVRARFTEQLYVVPFARPVTVSGEAVPLAVPVGMQLTV